MESSAINLPGPNGPSREQHPGAIKFGPDPLGHAQHSSVSEEDYRPLHNRPGGGPTPAYVTDAGHFGAP